MAACDCTQPRGLQTDFRGIFLPRSLGRLLTSAESCTGSPDRKECFQTNDCSGQRRTLHTRSQSLRLSQILTLHQAKYQLPTEQSQQLHTTLESAENGLKKCPTFWGEPKAVRSSDSMPVWFWLKSAHESEKAGRLCWVVLEGVGEGSREELAVEGSCCVTSFSGDRICGGCCLDGDCDRDGARDDTCRA